MGNRRAGLRSIAALVTVGAAALAAIAAPSSDAAPAPVADGGSAGDVVTVSGVAFPDPGRARLSFVGCDNLYDRVSEALQPMVGQGPGDAPSGHRSLAFDLAGGDAVGAMFPVSSMLGTTSASVEVHADGGTATGVAYAGYQAPGDATSELLWLGRADLSTPGGAWQTVDVTGRAFVWTQYDMTTHAVTDPGTGVPQTVADFAAAHGGDGAGLWTVGFGCNGTPFNIDDFRIGTGDGTTTFDLEGIATTVAMHRSGNADGSVTLRGVLGTDTGDAVPGATLLLEQSDKADGPWRAVVVVPVRAGVATTSVRPDTRTFYRWRFVDRPLASGSVSPVEAVAGSDPTTDPTATPTSEPTATAGPSSGPSAGPSSRPSESPSAGPTDGPTERPSAGPSAGPSEGPSAGPSAGPSETAGPTSAPTSQSTAHPTDSASPSPTASGPGHPSSEPPSPTSSTTSTEPSSSG